MSASHTATSTYTSADIENVVRRLTADLVMIASSSGGASEDQARKWAHDIELLAKGGYLKAVDLTLLSGEEEHMATRFEFNPETGAVKSSRPGARWPRVPSPRLSITLFYTSRYDAKARLTLAEKLSINWTPSTRDTSHASLKKAGGRNYVSGGYGIERQDFER